MQGTCNISKGSSAMQQKRVQTLQQGSPGLRGWVYFAGYEYDGGIIITASHLPFNRNGFKFFTKEGGLEKANIKDVLQRAAAAAHSAGMSPNARHTDDAFVMDAALSIDPSSTPKVGSPVFYTFMTQLLLLMHEDLSWTLPFQPPRSAALFTCVYTSEKEKGYIQERRKTNNK